MTGGTQGPLTASELKAGEAATVYYFPSSGLIASAELSLIRPTVAASGSIVQIISPSTINLNTSTGPIFVKWDASTIVIKADGSVGTTSDLTAGQNIRTFFSIW